MSASIQIDQKEPLIASEHHEEQGSTAFQKISSALFYAFTSFMITVVNKSVLTSYSFPSFTTVALGQMITTVLVLRAGKKLRMLTFPDLHRKTFSQLTPLPLIYVANMVFGLGGTKELSLPMFTMLRRFSILMTMLAEYWILDVVPELRVKISIGFMILGAIIAAGGDLAFNLEGYIFVLLSDILTASNGVYTKKILSSNKEMGKYGLMYYCALFMTPFAVLTIIFSGETMPVLAYKGWNDPFFILQFFSSCCMGFILNYSIVFCTHHNSALTTTIMGCLKNILVTYLGMFIGGDYIFSMTNFLGINLSIIGSLLYTYVTFKPPPKINHSIKI